MHRSAALLFVLFALPAVRAADITTPAALPPACSGFQWDVQRELTLLQAPALAVAAGATAQTAPTLALERHYRVQLPAQDQVRLAARPGKPMLEDAARAGLLAFDVPRAGDYRIAITSGHWLDVVDAGRVIPSRDFQGQRGCPLVHKIVAYRLPAGRLLLQLAGGADAEVGVVIVPAADG
ncbi:hypothetical protein [Thermomonas flagellata]|uniref:hypothetical protein n=1 Tax=Thermomonas flagellata TaxID=2888524 RepID=UPI001F03849E|nr:hypothetical protein [Thermomonas flagellata]